ncbi:MAG: ribosome silencing factor [Deferribacteraceae bacterium]|jgi:ribosome-associated protein|nr:ribosome silencing factor [Deferribacteraceae bacterium]
MDSYEMANKMISIAGNRLGEDIVCLDLRGVSPITDFLMIVTGKADTHVKALSWGLIEEMKKVDIAPLAYEGLDLGTWACVDYGDVIIHIMKKKEREIYDLQAIWGGARHIV